MMRPLAVIGNVNVDLIMGPIAPWPLAGTEVITDHDQLRAGGAAAYAAFTWMALGAEFQIAANIGHDTFGKWLAESFKDYSHHWPKQSSSTTISVGITHPDGERTFFTTRGHLHHLSWASVRESLNAEKLRGGLLLLAGSFLTDSLTKDYNLLFEWAKANEISIALDPGWPSVGWTEKSIAAAREWVRHSNFLLINEIEAKFLTETSTIETALERLHKMLPGEGVAVIKAGALGAFSRDANGTLLNCKAPQVNVIDTIGAGDIFNASFLNAIAQGRDVMRAMAAGVNGASTAISSTPRQYAAGAAVLKKSA
jgi:sugar/nucleoside kinase (ribokinase family)